MENIWTKINDDIPLYMGNICEKYKLLCIKISPLKTALVGKKFALIVAIDRFDAKVSYLCINGKEIRVYLCDNYFAEKYDENDRVNLLSGEGAECIVRNNIIIMANGLLNKWRNVLEGERDWLENYKKSKWFSEQKLPLKEIMKIEQYF
ncbi:MAG: hypothetical protein HDR00_10035 [Lachnospiraceae bacterium]|nr:hypothetical protein [Lachnospiraceae bacterium]